MTNTILQLKEQIGQSTGTNGSWENVFKKKRYYDGRWGLVRDEDGTY